MNVRRGSRSIELSIYTSYQLRWYSVCETFQGEWQYKGDDWSLVLGMEVERDDGEERSHKHRHVLPMIEESPHSILHADINGWIQGLVTEVYDIWWDSIAGFLHLFRWCTLSLTSCLTDASLCIQHRWGDPTEVKDELTGKIHVNERIYRDKVRERWGNETERRWRPWNREERDTLTYEDGNVSG
jgi:hypothetical protein